MRMIRFILSDDQDVMELSQEENEGHLKRKTNHVEGQMMHMRMEWTMTLI